MEVINKGEMTFVKDKDPAAREAEIKILNRLMFLAATIESSDAGHSMRVVYWSGTSTVDVMVYRSGPYYNGFEFINIALPTSANYDEKIVDRMLTDIEDLVIPF